MISIKKITITKAKPNPTGKDRFYHTTPNSQLVAEWVDITNSGSESFPLNSHVLQHVAYSPSHPNGLWTTIMSFNGDLGIGETVRIHSGDKPQYLAPEDANGADYHLYTGDNYVWNNDKSDTARVKNTLTSSEVDSATYDAYPEEGKILKRVGSKLV